MDYKRNVDCVGQGFGGGGVKGGVSDSITFIKVLLEHWFSTFSMLPLFSTVHVVTYNHKIISGATL